VKTWRKNKAAIIWESEPGEVRTLTYQQLLTEVKKFANVLKSLDIKSGDRVAIYMGMCPELPIAMLACARIGAVHSVMFGGFSSNALVDRITDQEAVAVITQDSSYRRGGEVKLKAAVDEAMDRCPSVKHVVVYKRTGSDVTWQEGRDHWWHELIAKASDNCPAEELDSEHPLTFSIPQARPESPRVSCAPRAGTRWGLTSLPNGYLISRKKTPTGAPPTSDGSPDIVTSSTDRCRMGRLF
jgi:acetyl-CoA synthetase